MAKYDPLHMYLVNSADKTVRLTFAEIDSLVGGLPASAHTYRAWWNNEVGGNHVQARAWMTAGYDVLEIVLDSWVVFERRKV